MAAGLARLKASSGTIAPWLRVLSMARGNFESESSHFRPAGQLRCLGPRFVLWVGDRGYLAGMGTFGVKVPI